jgi:hypothetical protein
MPRLRKPDLPPGVMDICTDYLGRAVMLEEARWNHILEGHPEMDGLHLAVKTAVERADHRAEGNGPGIEKLYGAKLGPAAWLVVVVAYGPQGRGNILTAYPQAKDPS